MPSVPLWRQIQKENFHSLEKLASFLDLDTYQTSQLTSIRSFPLNLPYRLAKKITKRSLQDPILRQFIPLIAEQKHDPNFSLDPVQDETFRQAGSKLIHKYSGRALLTTSSACTMHCRYCFRKNFSYETSRKGFAQEITSISQNISLSEIILSGGDPLSLSNEDLADLLSHIEIIPHIQRIRFHSRFPIGIPERIDNDLIELLQKSRKQIIFVIHTNHPNELDEDIFSALNKIQKLAIPVLNQSVLLRDVNDCAHTLANLCLQLSNHGVLPYYLHHLDPVTGTTHFSLPEHTGKEIMRQLATMLPGYSLPRYVKEIPGKSAKTPIWFELP